MHMPKYLLEMKKVISSLIITHFKRSRYASAYSFGFLSARGTRALIHLAFFFVILFSALLQIFAYSYKYMLVSGLYVSVHVSKCKLVSVSAS